jgi:LPS-assembly protein
VPYDMGYAETKAHGTVEADWQKRWIVPGGVAVTPYLGLRADAAYADVNCPIGSSTCNPGVIDLFNATPIAAVDVRFPMAGRLGSATQVLQPIAQLVYRASDTTDVGITNDNAQSFVFDDSNLFSYNRFSGTDRQETGLRANLGGQYQVDFDNGNWLNLIGGQSFQLAGPNAFAAADPTQATTGQGLSASNSYVVMGATGSPLPGLTLGSKLQVDPAAARVTRFGAGGTYGIAGYAFNLDYLYIAQNLDRGVLNQQQEVAGGVSVPLADYWRVNTHASWDLAANTWLDAGGGVVYDDGYLTYGGSVEATGPTNTDPNDLRFLATFNLKGLSGG